jgi:hypothetical protein
MGEGIEVRWSGEIESGLRRSQNPKMSIQHDFTAIVSINGEITVDAHLIAPPWSDTRGNDGRVAMRPRVPSG